MHRRYRVGGMTVGFSGQGQGLEALRRAWAGFETDAEGDAQVLVEVDASRPCASTPAKMPEVRQGADGAIQLEGPSFTAEIDRYRRAARVRGADERFGLETAVKYLLAARLASAGGLLVHGVALAHEGRAGLFTGPSGAGKSTLAKLGVRAGFTLLADELVAVWKQPPGFRAEGTPWNEGRPEGATLVGLGTLAWTDGPRLERQPASNVLRVLASNVLMADPSGDGKAASFHAQAELVSGVQTWTLYFARDENVGDVLRQALKP